MKVELSARSIPTGPGSRGGHWHEPEYRRAYARAWRAAHPEYRERERLRAARRRDPNVIEPPTRQLPMAAQTCGCACPCREAVVVVCGFCRDGQHA